MSKIKNQDLLNDPRVQEEISRHRWFESEKASRDIGYETACTDWLNRYSDAWIKANCPKEAAKTSAKTVKAPKVAKPAAKTAKKAK